MRHTRWWIWGALILIGYLIISQPASTADMAGQTGSKLQNAADAFGTFINSL